MKEIVNLPELSKNLRKLAGWFSLYTGFAPEAKENCAKVCEDAANELDAFRNSPARFSYKECEIPQSKNTVELWYVVGIPDVYYPTKIVAEQAARISFPNDPHLGYGRIYYSKFFNMREQ